MRCLENPGLFALHTVFIREHNRQCDELKVSLQTNDDYTLYNEARRWIIAYIQSFTLNTYFPATLGTTITTAYHNFNETLDPSISLFFSAVAYGWAPTTADSVQLRLDTSYNSIQEGNLVLLYSFYKPQLWEREGMDVLLRGLVLQRHRKVGLTRINDYRNALFGGITVDPVATLIQRSRDLGMPLYNDARAHLGLPRATKFSDISSNPNITKALEAVYGDIDKVEAFVGGLAEDHVPNGAVGILFAQSIISQFLRLRDADRFFWRNAGFGQGLNNLLQTRLADIVIRNSHIAYLPCEAFNF